VILLLCDDVLLGGMLAPSTDELIVGKLLKGGAASDEQGPSL
jgi:hypothetical protein